MALIEWNDSRRTGDAEIDTQHEALFGLLNLLHDRILSGMGASSVGEVLEEMTEYVSRHFRDEEEAMAASGYPGEAAHRAIHELIRGKVDEFRRSRSAGDQVKPLDLVQFLSAWIQHHILEEDMQLARWLQTWRAGGKGPE